MNYQAIYHGGQIERNLSGEPWAPTDTPPSRVGAGVFIFQLPPQGCSKGVLILWHFQPLHKVD